MRSEYTHVSVLLDRSGSMDSIRTDVEGGFNSFIKSQKAVPGKLTVTLSQFDDLYELVYSGKDIHDVPPLNLVPRNMTALTDSLAKVINDTGAALNALPENVRPGKVLILIITDGLENASREFTAEQVAKMVKHQQEKYAWSFQYLGANQDAVLAAQAVGIDAGVNYKKERTQSMFAATSASLSRNRVAAPGRYEVLTQLEVDEAAEAENK